MKTRSILLGPPLRWTVRVQVYLVHMRLCAKADRYGLDASSNSVKAYHPGSGILMTCLLNNQPPARWLFPSIHYPTSTQRNDNVIMTSKRRRDVVLTSLWRYYCVLCPLWSAMTVLITSCGPSKTLYDIPEPVEIGPLQAASALFCLAHQGWGLLSKFPPIRCVLFSIIVKTNVSYWILCLYLAGVATT